MVSIIGLAAPSQQATEPTPQTAYEYNRDLEADVAQAAPVEEVEPEIVVEPEPVVEPESYTEPEPYIEPEPYVEPEPITNEMGYYIDGTCKDLKAPGLGPFYPGDANYTSKRDRDSDGVACE